MKVPPPFDAQKFKELVLYVATRSEDDPSFGSIKLNKVLFYSDFLAYARFGKAITGARYQRLPFGPAARALLPAERELTELGDAKVETVVYFGRSQNRLVALRAPNMTLFTTHEVKLVEEVIVSFRDLDGMTLSHKSHRDIVGWSLVKDRQEIPYVAVFLSPDAPPREAVALAQELAARGGWLAF